LNSSTSQDEPVAHSGLRTVAILAASSLTLFAMAAVAPALPAIERAYPDVPDVALLTRMVLTITALFIALSAPFAGFLIDRIGRKPVLLAALALYLVSGTAAIWLNELRDILISRAVLGIAIGMILTTATTLIGDFYQGESRNRMAGAQIAVMVLGVAAGTTLAGFLADTDWRLPFYMYLIAVLVVPLVLFGIREPETTLQTESSRGLFAPGTRFPVVRVGMIYALIWLSLLSTFVIPSQTAFLLPEIGIPGAFIAGISIAVFNVVGAAMAMQFRRLRVRFDNNVILAGSFVFLGIGLLLSASAESIPQVMLGMILAGFGFGPLMPALNAWLLSVAPVTLRGRLVGGLTFFQFLGMFASPFYSQPVADIVGMTGAFALTGLGQITMGLTFVGAAISTIFFGGMGKRN